MDEGILAAARLALPFALPGGGEARATTLYGRLGDHTFATLQARSSWSLDRPDRPWRLGAEAGAGFASPGAPVQHRYHLGGRRTLGGHDYRSLSGRAYWLARVVATRSLLEPWLGLRAIAAAGGVHAGTGGLPEGWPDQATGVRGSVGAGVALGWDVLYLDLLRGVGPGGGWELVFSVRPGFHPWL